LSPTAYAAKPRINVLVNGARKRRLHRLLQPRPPKLRLPLHQRRLPRELNPDSGPSLSGNPVHTISVPHEKVSSAARGLGLRPRARRNTTRRSSTATPRDSRSTSCRTRRRRSWMAPRRTCPGWAERQWFAVSGNRAANPYPAGISAICRVVGVTSIQRLV